MQIEVTCHGCARRLRVPSEHAGRSAKCPNCESVFTIPAAQEPPLASLVDDHPAPAGGANPYAAPDFTGPIRAAGYARPHRGGLVLTLGIIGLVACGFVGIAAWIMGAGDLRAMQSGRMDPSGRDLTQVGMILGIVTCVLMALGLVFFLLVFAVSV
jgi:hypothetical protein